LGNQINGVETASQYYFGISASRLNIPQAAYLAGMLKSPMITSQTSPTT